MKKFELIPDSKIEVFGRALFRVRALVAFVGVDAGDEGGYVEKEENLNQEGNAWVCDNAQVYGDARVYGVNNTATRSDNYTFMVAPTPDGPRIIAGCRYFTFDEARAHWVETRGGTRLGDESLALVDHLERMAAICGFLEPVIDEVAA